MPQDDGTITMNDRFAPSSNMYRVMRESGEDGELYIVSDIHRPYISFTTKMVQLIIAHWSDDVITVWDNCGQEIPLEHFGD